MTLLTYMEQLGRFFYPYLELDQMENDAAHVPLIRDWAVYLACDKTFLNQRVHNIQGKLRPGLVQASQSEIGSAWGLTRDQVINTVERMERKLIQKTATDELVSRANLDCESLMMMTVFGMFQFYLNAKN